MTTLLDIFNSFKDYGGKTSFIYRTGVRRFVFSYHYLYKQALNIAAWLEHQGIVPGDRVALWAPNSPWWGIAYWGIIVRGAIVVPIDFMSNKDRAELIIKHCDAKFVIQSQYKLDRVESEKSKVKSINVEELEYTISELPVTSYELPVTRSDDAVELVYTSGTTGNPKGVKLTHKNLVANLISALKHIDIRPESRFLSVLPLSHMFEQMGGFLVPLSIGSTVVYNRTIKPSSIMSAFIEENITYMMIVPRLLQALKGSIERELESKHLGSIFRRLLKRSQEKNWRQKKRKKIFFPIHKKFGKNFQYFISGGATLDKDTARFWKYLGFILIEGYGLTECSPVLTLNTANEQVIGSVGKPVPGVTLDIRDKEIIAKGDNIFKGYWQNDQATQDAFTKDGWYRTGDIGFISEDNNLYIKGRIKEMIVTGAGVNIYPDDIEPTLNSIEGVKESCIIGVDRGHGEEIHAVIILSTSLRGGEKEEMELDNATAAKMIVEDANQQLDALQKISGYTIWPEGEFPKTPTLKIQKFKVKQALTIQEHESDSAIKQDQLIQIIRTVTGKPVDTIRDSSLLVTDLGLTSIARLELVNYIEQEFRLDMEDTMINQHTTVKDLRTMIEKREKKNNSKKMVRLWVHNRGARHIRSLLQMLFKPVLCVIVRLSVNNARVLRDVSGPVIFIANHISYVDGPSIYAALPPYIRCRLATASYEGLFFSKNNHIIKKIIGYIWFEFLSFTGGAFVIAQQQAFRASLSFMGTLIDRSINILFFPEGTRSQDASLLPFQKGLGIIVKELKVPVIPIKISGVEKVMPRGAFFPKRGRVTITFGEPFVFTKESPREIIALSRNMIAQL